MGTECEVHIIFMFFRILFFPQIFENINIIRSQTVQKRVVDCLWPVGHSLLVSGMDVSGGIPKNP